MQDSTSEHTTHWTMKQMDYSRRRPHWWNVCLLRLKMDKKQTDQNWTREHCKKFVWFEESWFWLWHVDSRIRIVCKLHEIMDPRCLVSTVWASRVWRRFFISPKYTSTFIAMQGSACSAHSVNKSEKDCICTARFLQPVQYTLCAVQFFVTVTSLSTRWQLSLRGIDSQGIRNYLYWYNSRCPWTNTEMIMWVINNGKCLYTDGPLYTGDVFKLAIKLMHQISVYVCKSN